MGKASVQVAVVAFVMILNQIKAHFSGKNCSRQARQSSKHLQFLRTGPDHLAMHFQQRVSFENPLMSHGLRVDRGHGKDRHLTGLCQLVGRSNFQAQGNRRAGVHGSETESDMVQAATHGIGHSPFNKAAWHDSFAHCRRYEVPPMRSLSAS